MLGTVAKKYEKKKLETEGGFEPWHIKLTLPAKKNFFSTKNQCFLVLYEHIQAL